GRPLAPVLSAAARRWPARLAVAAAGARPGPGGLRSAALAPRAARAAAALPGLGLPPGARVLLPLPPGCP
ncbi:2,3-dihydroxybenzoate-AMP ligase, partial [Mycobacterium tuberculosis]